jgi:peptide/nickel transport system substrate-binding protein
MRKLFALLLAVALALPATGALAQAADAANPYVVAAATRMSGNLYTDMWGVNSVDASVRALLSGYSTIAWSYSGEYGVDSSVVTAFASEDNARGDRTYRFELAKDMTYNDGTPITAADYVFSALLQCDPAIPLVGGQNTGMNYLQGYQRYADGKTGVLSGVRLLGDYAFSITVPVSALPFFYELSYANLTPSPIGVIAPGFAVYDAGNGAYLAQAGQTAPAAPAASPLTAELLGVTLTAEDGYLHQPRVTSGPYQLAVWDPAEATVTLTINPRYRGNAEGRKPELEAVKIVSLSNAAAFDAFAQGTVQMIHNMSDPDVVEAARQMSIAGTANLANHLNSGYAFLAYACELAPTDDVNVRRAIALCVDRAAFITGLYRDNALPVYGYYGYAQWMLQEGSEALAKYDLGFDVETARELLEKAGYVYNEDKKPFVAGKGQVRCKLENGVLVPLALNWAKTASRSADLLKEQLTTAFDQLGIALTIDEMSFTDLLRQYYRVDGERTYQLMFLSELFPYQFDPYFAYQVGDEWQGASNTSGLRDDKLMRAALNMRRVESGDTAGYMAKWAVFQDRWHDVLPTMPIYCTVEFDVSIPSVYLFAEYGRDGLDSAILYATFTEPVLEPDVAEAEATAAP